MSARLNPQIQALLDAEAAGPQDADPPTLETLRAGYARTAMERGGPAEPVDAAEDIAIARPDGGSVRARVYTPLGGARVPGRLIWLHGGGWVLGDIEGFDLVCRSLANAGGFEVVSLGYRLAPEHPFPAAVQDADAAVAWAAAQDGPVAVGGDSAGGNLAAVAALHAPDAVSAQVLVYPATDAAMTGPSYTAAEQPGLKPAEMAACWAAYRVETDPGHPDLSPLGADLSGAPPAFVGLAGFDVLRSDGEAYAEALRAAGVDVELVVYEDMTHGFMRWGGVVDRAGELISQIAAFTAAQLSR